MLAVFVITGYFNYSFIVIPISLNYCPLVRVKIFHGCVAYNPNSQLLLNQAPCHDLFFLRTTRVQT